MKKWLAWALCLIMLLTLLTSCQNTTPSSDGPTDDLSASESDTGESSPQSSVSFTDALGYDVSLSSWDQVISLYGSFAESWTLAGGTLIGTTEDAVEERGLTLGDDVTVVGTVQHPNLEEILALSPDFVLLSADTAVQATLHDALTEAGIPHAYFRTNSFEEYLTMLRLFCDMTGRDDLYEQNGLAVQTQINAVLDTVQGANAPAPTALLLRAFSSGCNAKGADNLAGAVLADLGADNLVEQHESLLEDVSIEQIIVADPDYILVVTMGSSQQKALDWLQENLESNPAWAGLSAVQSKNYVVLPKELFHYKPNARWGESYEYLAKILYPDLAAEIG